MFSGVDELHDDAEDILVRDQGDNRFLLDALRLVGMARVGSPSWAAGMIHGCRNFGHLIERFAESKLLDMSRFGMCLVFLSASSLILFAKEQGKPSVFVQESVSSSTSGGGKLWGVLGSKSSGSQDNATNFGKDLQENCPAVTVTPAEKSADYIIILNVTAKRKPDNLADSQVQIHNRAGKSIGTNFLHTVGNAAKDACQLIVPDWQAHGGDGGAVATTPEDSELTPGVTEPPQPTTAVEPIRADKPLQENVANSSTGVATGGAGVDGESMGDAGRRAKQHLECLKVARENPNVTCK